MLVFNHDHGSENENWKKNKLKFHLKLKRIKNCKSASPFEVDAIILLKYCFFRVFVQIDATEFETIFQAFFFFETLIHWQKFIHAIWPAKNFDMKFEILFLALHSIILK